MAKLNKNDVRRLKEEYEEGLYMNMTTSIPSMLMTIEAQQQEIEQLREACIKGFSYLSLLFHRADIRNWNTVGMCSVRDIKNVLSELENAYNATKQSVSDGKENEDVR